MANADVSTREEAKIYLEWAECARRDALRAAGRGARESYLAAAEQWDAQALDIKRKLWREGGGQLPRGALAKTVEAHQRSAATISTDVKEEPERYKRQARRPRTPSPAVPIRIRERAVPLELHCTI
jgi:hypothetical protein